MVLRAASARPPYELGSLFVESEIPATRNVPTAGPVGTFLLGVGPLDLPIVEADRLRWKTVSTLTVPTRVDTGDDHFFHLDLHVFHLVATGAAQFDNDLFDVLSSRAAFIKLWGRFVQILGDYKVRVFTSLGTCTACRTRGGRNRLRYAVAIRQDLYPVFMFVVGRFAWNSVDL